MHHAHPPSPDRPREPSALVPHAFSLVELLVSIAVIGLLLAILLPALGGARESGRAAVCASNLRQIQLGSDAYANDHHDRYCPGAADALSNLNRWHGSRTTASAPFSPGGGALTPYLAGGTTESVGGASLAIRTCPAFATSGAAPGFEHSAGGYGYNNTFVGTDRAAAAGPHGGALTLWTITTDRLGAPRSRFADPAATIAFADAALATGGGGSGLAEYSFVEPRFWPDFDPPSRPDPSIHFRHFRARGNAPAAANACWLDGHASLHRRTFSTSTSPYGVNPAEFGVGWFGERDDNSLFDYH